MTEVMEKVQQSVPSLRFPGFKGEWPVVPMERVADIERGRFSPRPRNDPRFYGGAIPFVQTNDVVNCGGVIEQYSQTLNEEGLAVSKLFPAGSILMTIAANIGHTGVLQVDMACPDSLVGIKCKPDYHNYFLNHFLSTQQTTLEYLAPEGAQKNINLEVLRPFRVPNPTLPEQQKIAAFLGAVDRKIQQLKRKQALLEQYKKGVVQQLFSQKLRFKREDGSEYPEWEERELGEVLTEHKLTSTGNEEVYSVSVHKSLINQVEHLGRVYAAETTDHYNRVLPGDIVYTKSPTGEFKYGIIKQSRLNKAVIVSPLYGVFTPETRALGYWLDAYFESIVNTYNYLHPIVQKGAKNTIAVTNRTFLSNTLRLPVAHEEQEKIAGFLMALDAKVAGVAQAVAAAEKWKKGLLQQMFV